MIGWLEIGASGWLAKLLKKGFPIIMVWTLYPQSESDKHGSEYSANVSATTKNFSKHWKFLQIILLKW